MTKEEIIAKVKALNLPTGSYVLFGSTPMAAAGIREAKDIDMVVTKEVLAELQKRGWKEFIKGRDDKPLTYDVFEAHDNWNFSAYNPTLEHLLKTATIIDGVPFVSLSEVRKWKTASNSPKHRADVALIDAYLESKS